MVLQIIQKNTNNTYYQIAREEVSQLVLEHKLRKGDETLEEFLTSKVPARIDGVTRKDDNTLIVKKNGYEIEVQEVKAESQTLTLNVLSFYKKVKKVVVNQLSVDESLVTPEASFSGDLGADSLDTVELVMAFEEEFGCEIPEEEAEKIQTVQDAVNYIEAHS